MDHAARVDAVERELGALVTAVAGGPIDAPVPSCPEFDVGALADHVGSFCGFWTHVLCEGTGRRKPPFREAPEAADHGAWLDEVAAPLVAELRATPPDTAVWTWHEPDQRAAFVARRCSHELAVHRFDAQLARGAAEPIETALAADGIEEVFLLATERRGQTGPQDARSGSGQTLHLHGTDHDPAEWLVTLAPNGIEVVREHAKGDLALRGTVSDLELLLYARPPVSEVQRFGDESVLDAFHHVFTF